MEDQEPVIGKFKRERDNNKRKTKVVALFILFLTMVFGGIWIIFFSGYLDVGEYDVATLKVLDRGAVVGEMERYFDNEAPRYLWGSRNLLVMDLEGVKKYLETKFFIKSVTVDKKYPNILRLKIEERQRSLIVATNNQMYIVDDYGVANELADELTVSSTRAWLNSPKSLPAYKEIVIVWPTSTVYKVGEKIFDQEDVRLWLDLSEKLHAAGLEYRSFSYDAGNPSFINLKLDDRLMVLMDKYISLDDQIETLRQYLSTKPDLSKVTSYLDVRVPGKIFYK